MTKGRTAEVVVLAVVVSGLSGCAMFNKGTLYYSRTTTMGTELIDLQEAKAKGALSDAEYAKAKKDILRGGPLMVGERCADTK